MAKIKTTEEDIKERLSSGFINSELEPIKCWNCGSTEFRDVCTDRIDFLEVERDRFCVKCNEIQGSWSYGFWQP